MIDALFWYTGLLAWSCSVWFRRSLLKPTIGKYWSAASVLIDTKARQSCG
jgi:hypothetical protein